MGRDPLREVIEITSQIAEWSALEISVERSERILWMRGS